MHPSPPLSLLPSPAFCSPRYLVADYSLHCHDAEWNRLLPFALFMVVFFVFGVPLLLLGLLVRHRAAIMKIGRAIDEEMAEAVVLKELGETIDIDKARALYRLVDTDNSGSIDFIEFAKFQLSQNEGRRSIRRTVTEDGNATGVASSGGTVQQWKGGEHTTVGGTIDGAVGGVEVGERATHSSDALGSLSQVSLEMVVVGGVGGEEKGDTDNRETKSSSETKGSTDGSQEARPRNLVRRTSTRTARLVASHILNPNQVVSGDTQGVILAKERAAMEEDGMEMMLGMLWMNYNPEHFYFDMYVAEMNVVVFVFVFVFVVVLFLFHTLSSSFRG